RRSRTRRCRSQPKGAGVVNHGVCQVIYNLGFINRDFKQRAIEDVFTLLDERLGDLLSDTGTLERTILGLQSLFLELEDVPLAVAEANGVGDITSFHAEEFADQFCGKTVLLQII